MADSLSDPEFEAKMKKVRDLLDSLKTMQTVFNNTFQTMRAKERADMVRKIQGSHKTISDFINGARKHDLRAPSLKFGLENIKQKYQMAMSLWRKTEKLLDNAAIVSHSLPEITLTPVQAGGIDSAVNQYVSTLDRLGHKPTTKMVEKFKNQLESAYTQAKEKIGKDLEIQVIEEGGKIKVRMEPK